MVVLTVKSKVLNGRLVVDEATDLPEGEEVELVAVMEDGEDHLGEPERAALHAALAQAKRDIEAGNIVDGDDVLAELRSRSPS